MYTVSFNLCYPFGYHGDEHLRRIIVDNIISVCINRIAAA